AAEGVPVPVGEQHRVLGDVVRIAFVVDVLHRDRAHVGPGAIEVGVRALGPRGRAVRVDDAGPLPSRSRAVWVGDTGALWCQHRYLLWTGYAWFAPGLSRVFDKENQQLDYGEGDPIVQPCGRCLDSWTACGRLDRCSTRSVTCWWWMPIA